MSDEMKKKDLIKEAYRFGYFVGYRGHTEWVSWVSKKKVNIYSLAEELGILEEVKMAYEEGLKDGKAKRLKDISSGLLTSSLEGEPKQKEGDEGLENELEKEFSEFLTTPKIIEPPKILSIMKSLEPPKMLSLPKILTRED
ncbi:hypothetical protein NF865_03235 [Thermococcus aggregans]|uniref:Uncharacterized protein n=1 Tax=Thermococcus aggregans TaxID=110163 RepID=A0A9E7MYT8_THEAG|nr:hypothetical protein [Thermococcus aggregans]USS41226.1 hypothetical protein NF865_03235 [Thermococcus aggregans]